MSDRALPHRLETHSEAETEAFGRQLAERLRPGTVLALYGELGCGKTVLARGVARGLGIDEPVTSPTFTLVQTYEGPHCRLHHLDLYRLHGDADALAFGIDDYLRDESAVVVIEWAQRLSAQLLGPTVVTVRLHDVDRYRRLIDVGGPDGVAAGRESGR